jgi:microsomal epoxide hydrolase
VHAAAALSAAGSSGGGGRSAAAAESDPAPSTGARPFRIDIPQARLDRIMAKVRDVDWPDQPAGDPWKYGSSLPAMKDLVTYWTSRYDWRAQEAAMNRFPHFTARIEEHEIHFIHVKGSGENPQPIMLSHGWPGSFVEFLKVIDPLAHPERYGGKIDDAFSVVVPSLPGFGFSSKPAKPVGERTMARLFDKLMTATLGYSSYIAQGGDMGAIVSMSQGHDSKHCKAVHLNFLILLGEESEFPPFNAAEREALAHMTRPSMPPTPPDRPWPNRERGYAFIQMTKPLTLSYAMMDSPVGAAAWIFEKFRGASQLENGDPWSVYTKDEILDNIMVYLVTGTFGTATWAYAAPYGEGEDLIPPRMSMEKTPLGIAHYPGQPVLPRSWVARNYNLIYWNDLPAGGHFAAMEQPELFVDDLRRFGRTVRGLPT